MPALQLTPAAAQGPTAPRPITCDPVVMIGNDGLTAAVMKETDAALHAHGLIKVRVFGDDRDAARGAVRALADELGAAPIQHIGKLLVLWRPKPAEAPRPRARRPHARAARSSRCSSSARAATTGRRSRRSSVLGNQRIAAGGTLKRAKKRGESVKKQRAGLNRDGVTAAPARHASASTQHGLAARRSRATTPCSAANDQRPCRRAPPPASAAARSSRPRVQTGVPSSSSICALITDPPGFAAALARAAARQEQQRASAMLSLGLDGEQARHDAAGAWRRQDAKAAGAATARRQQQPGPQRRQQRGAGATRRDRPVHAQR